MKTLEVLRSTLATAALLSSFGALAHEAPTNGHQNCHF